MPTDLTNAIMDLAANKAANRTKAKKFKSFTGRKAKKAVKPKNIVKGVVTGLGGAIPVPGVSIATDWTYDKIAVKVRNRRAASKQRGYDNPEEDNTAAQLKKIKFDVKNFSLSHLDESRKRVAEQATRLNGWRQDHSRSLCQNAYDLAYRYNRLRVRVAKLKTEAEALKVIAEEILVYCNRATAELDDRICDLVEVRIDELTEHDSDCGKNCFNDEQQGERNLLQVADEAGGD